MRVRRDRSIEFADGRVAPSQRRSLAVFTALFLVVLTVAGMASAASGATSTEYVKSFGPDGTESSNFERINGVAVDQQTGDVYVLDGEAGALEKFSAAGQPLAWGGSAGYISGNKITGLAPFTGSNKSQIAVDSTSHVVYVTEQHSIRAFHENGEAAEFTAGPGANLSEIPSAGELVGVAVDSNGDIYATEYAGAVSVYAPTGEAITSLAVPTPPGNLSVASDGAVYVANSETGVAGGVHKFIPSEFPVTVTTTYTAGPILEHPSDNSSFTVGVGVNPVTDDVYVMETDFGSSWIKKYDSSGAFVRFFGKPGEEGELANFGQGIAVLGGGEQFQFYVGNSQEMADGFSKVAIFGEVINPGRPSIAAASASAVTADSATLHARINPDTFATTYHFEYGLGDCSLSASACASVPLGGAAIGDGHHIVAVSQAIADLQAGTTYHYRVVAENSEGPSEGLDHTFTTQVGGLGFQLADNRAWEMVSPPDKHGGVLTGTLNAHVQAAANGEALSYPSRGSIEVDPEGSRIVEESAALARWTKSDGWRSKEITLPNDRVTPIPIGHLNAYKLFSTDLSSALVEPRSTMPLSPQSSERTPYLRDSTEPATYTPLVTAANVPPGTEFGGDPNSSLGSVMLAGANPDLNHVALSSEVPLTMGAPRQSLYLWSAGQLRPLSVLPAAEGGAMVATRLVGSGPGSVRHAVSDDGSRVFWSTGTPSKITGLYLRDTVAEETARLDVVPLGGGSSEPVFQSANRQGTVAFFTDTQQLTADAGTSGADLYRCEISAGSPVGGCTSLVDITAPLSGSGESAEVQGRVSGISDDGETVYFVAKGVLDNAANGASESAVAGRPNLYLWREGLGVRYVATLAQEDENDWGGSVGLAYRMSAAASPSGRYLSFMSLRSLGGSANLDAGSGKPVEQVFRYDANADRLDCVSCNPTGGAPEGVAEELELVDPQSLLDPRWAWLKQRVAAILPEPTVTELQDLSLYSPRAVLNNGRVFFNAIDGLVPADSNGQWDVYQYEPTGVGDCTTSSGGAAISRSAGGCVSLISSGTAEKEAAFLDAGESGDDAFFLTPARLSVTDEDNELDAYDARVDGVPATLPPNTECLGEACQPPPVAPNDPTPASAAFKGPGNVKPSTSKRCAKSERQVRHNGKVRCVASRKHKPRHKGQAHRAGHSGRASR